MRIPLPKLLRHWREREFEAGLPAASQRAGLGLWAWLAKRPALYHMASRLAVGVLRLFGRGGAIRSLPLAGGWTQGRDLPAPEGGTVHAQWKAKGRAS